MAHHHFTVRSIEQVKLCTEVMSEARRNPEIARISAGVRRRRAQMAASTMFNAAAERGDIAEDVDIDGAVDMLMIIADGVWWRRALDPNFRAEALIPMFMDVARHMLRGRAHGVPLRTRRSRHEGEPHHRGRSGRRRRACGSLSGHLIPHESAESKAALRAGEAKAEKLFRVAVIETNVVPHSRKLLLSGRTEADRKVDDVARTDGVLHGAEGAPRLAREEGRRHRRAVRRGARGAGRAGAGAGRAAQDRARSQAAADRDQRRAAARARQPRSAAQGRRGRARGRRGRARPRRHTAPWDGVITEVSRGRHVGLRLRRQGDRADRRARSDAGGGRGVRAQARRRQGRRHGRGAAGHRPDREGRIRYVSKSASPTTRTYRVEVEMPNADGAIPDGITAEVAHPAGADAGDARAALGADLLVGRRLGVRTVDARATRSASFRSRSSRTSRRFMWVAGIADGARVIVQGQDFVREGQRGRAGRRGRRQPRSADGRQAGQRHVAASSTTPSATRG